MRYVGIKVQSWFSLQPACKLSFQIFHLTVLLSNKTFFFPEASFRFVQLRFEFLVVSLAVGPCIFQLFPSCVMPLCELLFTLQKILNADTVCLVMAIQPSFGLPYRFVDRVLTRAGGVIWS